MKKTLLIAAILVQSILFGLVVPEKADAAPFGLPIDIAKPFIVEVESEIKTEEHALYLTFSNLALVKNITYQLSYKADSIEHGVKGKIEPYSNQPIVRRIFFGACSRDICVLDDKITDIKLKLTTEYFIFGKVEREELIAN